MDGRASLGRLCVAILCTLLSLILHGCGGGGGGGPTPAPTPPSPPPGWTLYPIEVKAQHLYFSNNGSTFHPMGIAFPNVDKSASIDEYLAVLNTLKEHSSNLNMIRMYEVPPCAYDETTPNCLEKFMHHADSLGIYVLVPGVGTTWGYMPGPVECSQHTASWCYRNGNVLGFGQKQLQLYNYPNTLALVIGNELDQQQEDKLPIIKAYARDLRSYMAMCNRESESPSQNKMRQIPLMYASSDAGGDVGFHPKMQYLFCGNHSVSIDIFGLNIERFVDNGSGPATYKTINDWVQEQRFDGAYLHSEEGCGRQAIPDRIRSWAQVKDFFSNYPAISGFAAYAYYGNSNYNMFDSKLADAVINGDGTHFFEQLNNVGTLPEAEEFDVSYPECTTSLGGKDIDTVYSVHWYDTGNTSWPSHCPKPLGAYPSATSVVV